MTDIEKPAFNSDVDFCPDCGSIFPLPTGASDVVKCVLCGYSVDITQFDGREVTSTVVFNKHKSAKAAVGFSEEVAGPTVDRRCPKCGHEGMTYSTWQTRSADEGQTVFYTCMSCRFQDIEYS